MGENDQKLRINQEYKSNSNEMALNNDIGHIEKNIEGLEKNISELGRKRETELGDLADEKNYDLFFYIGGVLVLLNLIFNFSLIGLVISIVFGIMFFVYKKYFTKVKRAKQINTDIDKEIDDLKEMRAEREEEIQKAREDSGN